VEVFVPVFVLNPATKRVQYVRLVEAFDTGDVVGVNLLDPAPETLVALVGGLGEQNHLLVVVNLSLPAVHGVTGNPVYAGGQSLLDQRPCEFRRCIRRRGDVDGRHGYASLVSGL
jgi:hypothetical protein